MEKVPTRSFLGTQAAQARTLMAGFAASVASSISTLVAHADQIDPSSVVGSDPSLGNLDNLGLFVMKFVVPYQGVALAVLVLIAITLGIKIGASNVSGRPEGRYTAITGLFFIIVAGVVVIHAPGIVGLASTMLK